MKKNLTILFFFSLSFVSNGQMSFYDRLSDAAIELTKQKVEYDPSYYQIDYPNGDIPGDKGNNADVIIRAYRMVGIDLQKEIHEDMEAAFKKYPKQKKQRHTDTNIDHRRAANLMVFFSRHGRSGPISRNSRDYVPGDIVCWDLGSNITHIGIVVNVKQKNTDRYMVVHNIGCGQVLADCLFAFKIIGHYQYGGQ